jgi:hypothetical protein
MTIAIHPRTRGVAAETVQRRWRSAVLLTLIALLALAGFAIVLTKQSADANRMVAVLKATTDIEAGSTITSDELAITQIRVQDQAVLASLAGESERSQLVGQMAAQTVRAGSLIPAGLGSPQATSQLWDVGLPIKRMPSDLKPGDHVALVVAAAAKTGDPVEFVAIQDVQVIGLQSGSANLWLPPKVVAQMEWYADHGGVVLVKMPAGGVQNNLPAGGPSGG